MSEEYLKAIVKQDRLEQRVDFKRIAPSSALKDIIGIFDGICLNMNRSNNRFSPIHI
jgi:hypothetical protein